MICSQSGCFGTVLGLALAACATGHHGAELPYALLVSGGQCPPDVAFYHARGPEARTELGVVVPPGRMVTYLVGSEDPNVNGIGDGAFVSEGRNGHTFAVDVPFAAVSSISVTASGNATAQGSTCAAVAL